MKKSSTVADGGAAAAARPRRRRRLRWALLRSAGWVALAVGVAALTPAGRRRAAQGMADYANARADWCERETHRLVDTASAIVATKREHDLREAVVWARLVPAGEPPRPEDSGGPDYLTEPGRRSIDLSYQAVTAYYTAYRRWREAAGWREAAREWEDAAYAAGARP